MQQPPVASGSPAAKAILAALVVALCLWVGRGEWTRPSPRVGVGFDERFFPVRACDFIEAHGLRGRMFNQFYQGGYLLHRFWPDRGRLPFMDIHQSGGPEIRGPYMRAFASLGGWRTLDARFRFDMVLMDRQRDPRNGLLDALDADSTWALVFLDDVMAVYARREGPLAAVARDLAVVKEVSMAKWWITELLKRTCDEVLQFHGGYGYMMEYAIARDYLDARVQTIFAGTTEVMKLIIAKQMVL